MKRFLIGLVFLSAGYAETVKTCELQNRGLYAMIEGSEIKGSEATTTFASISRNSSSWGSTGTDAFGNVYFTQVSRTTKDFAQEYVPYMADQGTDGYRFGRIEQTCVKSGESVRCASFCRITFGLYDPR